MLNKTALAILRIVQTLYGQSLKSIRKTIARDCVKELENILSALYKTSNLKKGYKKPLLVITFYAVILTGNYGLLTKQVLIVII